MHSTVSRGLARQRGIHEIGFMSRKGWTISPNLPFYTTLSSIYTWTSPSPIIHHQQCSCQLGVIGRSLATTTSSVSPNAATAAVAHDKSRSDAAWFHKATERMVKAHVGSFDSRAWHEADWAMRFWNRQRTIESVYASLDLLDRFLREYCYQQRQQTTKENPPLPEVLTTASLNFTLHNWQACAKLLESSPQLIASLPSPTSILDTIEYWKKQSVDLSEQIPLQPNFQSFSIVIDALAFAQHHALQNDYNVQRDAPGSSAMASRDSYGNVAWQFSTTPAPIIAEKLLHRLVEASESDPALRPSIITFNNVINVWSRSGHPKAPEKAEEMLRTLQAMTAQPGWEDMHPKTSTYGSVINAWANSKSASAAKRVEQLVEEMKSAGLELNGAVHLGVLKAWISSPDPQASHRATDWLQGMIKAYLERWQQQEATREETQDATTTDLQGLKKNKPTITYFLSVLNTYVKRGDAQGATAILDQLHNLYETCGRDPDFCPNADVYNCVLRAWAKSRSSEAYEQSVQLLQIMRDLAESTGNASLVPNVVSYNALLSSSRHENGMQRAEEVFSLMENTPGIKPDLITYNTMLDVMAKSLREDAVERTEAMLRRMWGLYSSKAVDFMPDSTSYNTCINACKFRNDPDKAEALFREMQDRYQQTGNRRLEPNKMSYGSLITAWANGRHTRKAERAQEIFDSMVAAGIRPSTIEYNATIHAWASVGNVERAESLLDRALAEYTAGNMSAKPDVKTFSSLLNALAKRKSSDPWRDAKHAEAILMRMEDLSEGMLGLGVKPNTFSFNTVLDSFAKCKKNRAAPKHAERILRHMHALSEAGYESLKPTVISYTTVMNCWVQSLSEETADRVQQLFDDLKTRYVGTGDEDFKPSPQTYNALFGAFARDTKKADSLSKAMYHFDNLVEQYEQTKDITLRPAPMHFSVLLSAFSRRGMVDEAEQFLERVLNLCREYCVSDGEKLDVSTSFNAVIVAHAKSNQPGSAKKAQQTLRRMQVLDAASEHVVAPTSVVSYTSVMMAWSLVSDPDEKDLAVTKCEELLQEMLDHADQGDVSAFPNKYTFGTILQVIARSNHPQKKERAERLFQVMQQRRIRPDSFVRIMLEECVQ